MQKRKPFEVLSDLFPYINAILFLFLYFTLSSKSRIAGDDYYYLWLRNNFGAWGGMVYQYNAWSGRWFAHLVGCSLISLWKYPFFLPIVNTTTLILLFVSIHLGLERIFRSLNLSVNVRRVSI